MNLEGRSAIVSGGAGGLGGATVRRLAGLGVGTVIIDPDTDRSEALRVELGDSVKTVVGTTKDDDVVSKARDEAKSMGVFSLAISVTGVLIRSPASSMTRRSPCPERCWLRTSTCTSVARSICPASRRGLCLERTRRRRPARVIVQTASISAFDGQETMVPYAAAKGAITSMTLSMARDLAPMGVRVCAIAPGSFLTPLTSSRYIQGLLLRIFCSRGGSVARRSTHTSSKPSQGIPTAMAK